jgi:RNA polymerase sigma-70 factor (ECF subfamily)
MASITQNWKLADVANVAYERLDSYQAIYEQNCHRVYALAFWMTGNEMAAEDMTSSIFQRAFAHSASPSPDAIDRALLSEVRRLAPIGILSLRSGRVTEAVSARRNMLRVHLEQAVLQLPVTERLIFLFHDAENYEHSRIARLLGITMAESQLGLHEARLRIRELVASMN